MLSIIIPTLNEEKYLPLLLDSIKKQSFRDYEVIVADAFSEDRTREIARSYDCLLVDGGSMGKGKNEGAKAARYGLLLFLDADVVLPLGFLEKSLREFERRNLDVASFALDPITRRDFIKTLYSIFHNIPIKLIERFFPHGSMGLLVKKSIHRKVAGFDEILKLCEDVDYLKRVSKEGKFRILKSVKLEVSPRRFEKYGWVTTYLKLLAADIYTSSGGKVKSDIFKYKFGQYN